MELPQEVADLMRRVEIETGKPVELVPVDEQSTNTRMTPGREQHWAHVLRFKPDSPGLPAQIALLCLNLIRRYSLPPSRRWDMASTPLGREAVVDTLCAMPTRLSLSVLPNIAKMFYDDLLLQLLSTATEMRSADTLFAEMPGLRETYRDYMEAELHANEIQLNHPGVRAVTPLSIFMPISAMNAARALYVDRRFENTDYAHAYIPDGYREHGKKLIQILDEIPSDAAHDRKLVDAWGEELGLTHWYRWVLSVKELEPVVT